MTRIDEAIPEFLEEMPMLKKAVQLRKNPKLTFEDWVKALQEFRKEGDTTKEFEDRVYLVYMTSDPRRLKNHIVFISCTSLKEEGYSIKEISELTGLTTNKVHRVLTVEANKKIQTVKDIAFRCGVSPSTAYRILKSTEFNMRHIIDGYSLILKQGFSYDQMHHIMFLRFGDKKMVDEQLPKVLERLVDQGKLKLVNGIYYYTEIEDNW